MREFSQKEYLLTFDIDLIIDRQKYLTNCRFQRHLRLGPITDINHKTTLLVDQVPFNSSLNISLKIYDGLEEEAYLGTTSFRFFDQDLRLKLGSFYLIVWPFMSPTTHNDSLSPGEIDDQFYKVVRDIHFAEKETNYKGFDFFGPKTEEAILNKSLLVNQALPLTFIEFNINTKDSIRSQVVYMDCPFPVFTLENTLFDFPRFSQAEIHGFYVQENPYNNMFFVPSKYSDLLEVRDFYYDLNRDDDPITGMYLHNFDDAEVHKTSPTGAELANLQRLLHQPNFVHFTAEEKNTLYQNRYYLKEIPSALPKFLLSVNWTVDKNIEEGLKLLKEWAPVKYDDALFLLSSFFSLNEIYPCKYHN
jgi:hypothetical protein